MHQAAQAAAVAGQVAEARMAVLAAKLALTRSGRLLVGRARLLRLVALAAELPLTARLDKLDHRCKVAPAARRPALALAAELQVAGKAARLTEPMAALRVVVAAAITVAAAAQA